MGWYDMYAAAKMRQEDLIREAAQDRAHRRLRQAARERRARHRSLGEHTISSGEVIRLATRKASIHVVSGVVWVTRRGDTWDYVLGAGERLSLARKGSVVQAVGPATLRLERDEPRVA